MVVEDQQLVDRGVGADRDRDPAKQVGVAPDHRGVVERVADRRRVRQELRQSLAGRDGQLGQLGAEAGGLVGGDARVAARAGQDREAAVAARPGPRLGQNAGELQQLVRVVRPRRRRPPRPGRGTPAGRRRPLRCAPRPPARRPRRRPTFSTATRTPRSAQRASASARRSPSPSSSRNIATERTPVALADRRQPVAGVEHRLVAGGEDRVVADPAARAERVDGDVAALGDHRHAARAPAERPSRPTSAPASRPRRCRSRSGRTAAARRPAPPRGAPAPARARLRSRRNRPRARPRRRSRGRPRRAITAGTPAAGIATTTASTGSGRSVTEGTQGRPCTSVRRGFTPQTSPSKPGAGQVAQHDVAVGARPVVGTDHGDRARLEQRSGIGAGARGSPDAVMRH